MAKRTPRQKRRDAKNALQRKAAKEAKTRLASFPETIERLRTRRVAYRYGFPVLGIFFLLLIIVVILYAPRERVELLNEILGKLALDKIFKSIIYFILLLIIGGLWLARAIGSTSPDDDTEV